MKTIEQLEVELLMLKQKITEQYAVVVDLKSARDDLLLKIQNAKQVAQRDAERRARNAENACRRQARKIAERYGIKWEDDSYREGGEHNHLHYFPKPDWLEGDDPLGDGHYAYNWDETEWLVEFYAKHHPDHPDHANREYLEIAPHC